ncbi:MAG: hypothetical protein PVF17_12785, partial [Ignavibacteria bacterium]
KIYDAETGKIKSFIEFSPGEKSFFNDVYVKALIKKRNDKYNIFYSPVILDEADSQIQPEKISVFYEIQKDYWKNNCQVLIVSHTPTSHEYIEKKINMKDVLTS